jgi:hypothetical protein
MPGSTFGRDTGYPRVFVVFVSPSWRMYGQHLDYAKTASFPICFTIYQSLYYSTQYNLDTESVVK